MTLNKLREHSNRDCIYVKERLKVFNLKLSVDHSPNLQRELYLKGSEHLPVPDTPHLKALFNGDVGAESS